MATTDKIEKIEPGSFAALFEESMSIKEMRQGEVITAEVISLESDFVIVNAGLKSESVIKTEEFLSDSGEIEVSVGDLVKVAIEKLEDGYGSTILSRDKAKKLQAWIDLEEAMEEGRIINGFVSSRVKGGLRVTVNGIMAFLPGSLVDIRPVKDTFAFENKECELKVIKIDKKKK
jgi:small subunit ribosomal protein S1